MTRAGIAPVFITDESNNMSNSPLQRIYYTPRYTDDEAFDLCSPSLRKAISLSVISWCCRTCLRLERKHGTFQTIKILKQWNDDEASFIQHGNGKNKKIIKTTVVECNVKPLDDLQFIIVWMRSATNSPKVGRGNDNL